MRPSDTEDANVQSPEQLSIGCIVETLVGFWAWRGKPHRVAQVQVAGLFPIAFDGGGRTDEGPTARATVDSLLQFESGSLVMRVEGCEALAQKVHFVLHVQAGGRAYERRAQHSDAPTLVDYSACRRLRRGLAEFSVASAIGGAMCRAVELEPAEELREPAVLAQQSEFVYR